MHGGVKDKAKMKMKTNRKIKGKTKIETKMKKKRVVRGALLLCRLPHSCNTLSLVL